MEKRAVILQQIKNALAPFLGVGSSIFLFGSQANTGILSRSDLDIGFESKTEIPFRKFLNMKICLEDLPLLYRFDLVDFSKVSDSFKKNAYSNIEML